MDIGIDKMSFFVPPYALDMTALAEARGVDPDKYHIGLGQDLMAVNPASEDIVTLGANAAAVILDAEDRAAIDMVIVGTESSVDESKAAAVVLHGLLGIQPFARAFEIKEACYGATAGVLMARDYVATHSEARVLVVASDIARYGLGSGGEPTQGAGAVAMLITAQPRILTFAPETVALTQDIYDFWRPTGASYPTVAGKLSNETYMDAFAQVWQEYGRRTGRGFEDFAALAFHTPYTRMGKKALSPMLAGTADEARLLAAYDAAVAYSREVGNLYTGSLWLSLISLLEHDGGLVAGDLLGLFSYGSGMVAEFLSGRLVEGYESQLHRAAHRAMLDGRRRLSVAQYEAMYQATDIPADPLPFALTGIYDEIRTYRYAD